MKKALLVIDMLVDFIDPNGRLYIGENNEKVVEAVKEEIDKARNRGEPIIYVCDEHIEDDAEFALFPAHCLRGEKGAEIGEEIAPQPGDKVIIKRRFSGFTGTSLDITLREMGIEELTLVGVCTNICVLYTAADARSLNYLVRVPRNAVASFDQSAHEFALQEMTKTLGVTVL